MFKRSCAIEPRVVQYCDMRFMILCDRHHKVSPNPNPQQNSNSFVTHKERDTLWYFVMSIVKHHEYLLDMSGSVTPFEWNSSRTKNAKLSFPRTLSEHWIQFMSSIARNGEDGKSLMLEKLANIFKFGSDIINKSLKFDYAWIAFHAKTSFDNDFHFRIITDVVAFKSNTKYVVAISCDLKVTVTVTEYLNIPSKRPNRRAMT